MHLGVVWGRKDAHFIGENGGKIMQLNVCRNFFSFFFEIYGHEINIRMWVLAQIAQSPSPIFTSHFSPMGYYRQSHLSVQNKSRNYPSSEMRKWPSERSPCVNYDLKMGDKDWKATIYWHQQHQQLQQFGSSNRSKSISKKMYLVVVTFMPLVQRNSRTISRFSQHLGRDLMIAF